MADQDSRSGVRYATPELLAFVERHHAAHDPALERAFAAPAQHGMPAIQVSRSEGKTLSVLMRLVGARKVVEVGTLAGYSALRLLQGLPPDGRVWTVEQDPRHAQIARDNLAAAGVAERVEVLVGAALDLLPQLVNHGPFDAMFIDADKGNYPHYASWAAQHLRRGGLLIADNAYFFGQLLADSAEAAQMRQFHALVAEAFDSACIPTPDGLVVGLRR
ncbi:MAG TPA: O-methyltransferase [Polyangiales bacterium]